jgi:hypothetical protein
VLFVFMNVKNLYFSLNEINNIVCHFKIIFKQDFQQLIIFYFLKHYFRFVYFDKNVYFYFIWIICLLRNLALLSLIIYNHIKSYTIIYNHINHIFYSLIIYSTYENIKAKNIHIFRFFSNFALSHFSLNLSIQKISFRYKLFILEEKSFYRESIFFKSLNGAIDFKSTECRFTSWSLYQNGDLYIRFIRCFLNFMNEIIIVASNHHLIFDMTLLNQID